MCVCVCLCISRKNILYAIKMATCYKKPFEVGFEKPWSWSPSADSGIISTMSRESPRFSLVLKLLVGFRTHLIQFQFPSFSRLTCLFPFKIFLVIFSIWDFFLLFWEPGFPCLIFLLVHFNLLLKCGMYKTMYSLLSVIL